VWCVDDGPGVSIGLKGVTWFPHSSWSAKCEVEMVRAGGGKTKSTKRLAAGGHFPGWGAGGSDGSGPAARVVMAVTVGPTSFPPNNSCEGQPSFNPTYPIGAGEGCVACRPDAALVVQLAKQSCHAAAARQKRLG
jgi:hypothetical protein